MKRSVTGRNTVNHCYGLLACYIGAALLYSLFGTSLGQIVSVVLKALPAALLLLLAVLARGVAGRFVLPLALLGCLVGDVALALGQFLPGMAAFAFAHLLFSVCFARAPGAQSWRFWLLVC